MKPNFFLRGLLCAFFSATAVFGALALVAAEKNAQSKPRRKKLGFMTFLLGV